MSVLFITNFSLTKRIDKKIKSRQTLRSAKSLPAFSIHKDKGLLYLLQKKCEAPQKTKMFFAALKLFKKGTTQNAANESF